MKLFAQEGRRVEASEVKDEVGLESPSPHYGSLMLGAANSGAKGLKAAGASIQQVEAVHSAYLDTPYLQRA